VILRAGHGICHPGLLKTAVKISITAIYRPYLSFIRGLPQFFLPVRRKAIDNGKKSFTM